MGKAVPPVDHLGAYTPRAQATLCDLSTCVLARVRSDSAIGRLPGETPTQWYIGLLRDKCFVLCIEF